MNDKTPSLPPRQPSLVVGEKLRGAEKMARIPIKIAPTTAPPKKPHWIRAPIPGGAKVEQLKQIMRDHKLHSVCEEASCPNLGECFKHGTATFMIMGDICTRRCPFCDVAHGRPNPLDPEEPRHLAEVIRAMALRYVVITSVDRDDLLDGGAAHFADCIRAIRDAVPGIQIEVLVPDFRGRESLALTELVKHPPDVFNHNLETVPRLYRAVRPGADYAGSLALLKAFKSHHNGVPTKSGLMLGVGETSAEVEAVMGDLREHGVDMLTLGQYLQPSKHHLPVLEFIHPDEFERLRRLGLEMGFSQVASAPMVRSSYHADLQATGRFGH